MNHYLLTAILLFFYIGSNAQSPGENYVVTLYNQVDTLIIKKDRNSHSRVVGNEQSVDLLKVINDNFRNRTAVNSETGKYYPQAKSKIDSLSIGYYRGRNGNSALKYFISGHHRPLPKGYFTYENDMILINQLQYSATDFINISATWVPNGLFSGGDNIFIISPRATIPVTDIISIGFGSYFVVDTDDPFLNRGLNASIKGSYFAGLTLGSADNNITISLANPFNRPIIGRETFDVDFDDVPNIQFAAIGKLGPRISIMGEFIKAEDDVIATLAFKSHFKKWHFNYGLAVDGSSVIPVFGFQLYLSQPKVIPTENPRIFRKLFD